ncbi:hypothetical protein KIN20_029740 [Parelaphostrongylus tenuis]|uniref:Uncharacterized protein n=1 Tax=Parelaphostrongylus tenuis TaxID=148309 RepID=A0AAD5R2X2_PARTN|nr:hypothetical protein KIN20_029740 [Parelaphostrongylus tenuis]
MSLSDEIRPSSSGSSSKLGEDGDTTSSQLSALVNLSSSIKEKEITSEEADTMIAFITTQLTTELLSADKNLENQTECLEVVIEVLEALLPLSSPNVLNFTHSLLPYLLYRLKDSENSMIFLDQLSRCILILFVDPDNTHSIYLHKALDVLTRFCVENSKDFPFKPIIQRLSQYLKVLQPPDISCESEYRHHVWPENMRILMHRFLRTKTELLSDEIRLSFFSLVNEIVETLEFDWFAPNVSLLSLLVIQVAIEIRMRLDKVEGVSADVLAVCYHILEMAVHCVEESSFLDDSTATQIATSVREAALYSIDYWVKAKEEKEEKLDDKVELVLYRFISCILTVGGAEMLPETLVQQCSPHLLQVFQQAVTDGDYSIARLALPYLNIFNKLPDNTILLLVDLVISQFPAGDWADAMDDVVICIESFDGRKDFYSSKTLMEARTKIRATEADSALYSILSGLIAPL